VFCTEVPEDRRAFVPSKFLCITTSLLLRAGVPAATLVENFKSYTTETDRLNLPAIIVKLLESSEKGKRIKLTDEVQSGTAECTDLVCETCE
jgi:hypothetical protein